MNDTERIAKELVWKIYKTHRCGSPNVGLSTFDVEAAIKLVEPLLQCGQRLHDSYGWGGRTTYGPETWAWEAAIKEVLA